MPVLTSYHLYLAYIRITVTMSSAEPSIKSGKLSKTARSIAAYQQRIACSFFYSFAFFASLREVLIKKGIGRSTMYIDDLSRVPCHCFHNSQPKDYHHRCQKEKCNHNRTSLTSIHSIYASYIYSIYINCIVYIVYLIESVQSM